MNLQNADAPVFHTCTFTMGSGSGCCGQGRIDSVKINPSLLMMREWLIMIKQQDQNNNLDALGETEFLTMYVLHNLKCVNIIIDSGTGECSPAFSKLFLLSFTNTMNWFLFKSIKFFKLCHLCVSAGGAHLGFVAGLSGTPRHAPHRELRHAPHSTPRHAPHREPFYAWSTTPRTTQRTLHRVPHREPHREPRHA